MLSFVYSSWQQMFGEPFCEVMSGHFVLLCLKHECKASTKPLSVEYEIENMDSNQNPYMTKVSGKIMRLWLDGEMVIMELSSRFPLFVVVKLPCHTDNHSWKAGDFVEVFGELQFQTTPQLDFKCGKTVKLSFVKLLLQDNVSCDYVCSVDTIDVLPCQDPQKSS